MGRPAGSKAPPAKVKQGDDKVFGARRPLLNTKLPLKRRWQVLWPMRQKWRGRGKIRRLIA